jgi:hypothetical protein
MVARPEVRLGSPKSRRTRSHERFPRERRLLLVFPASGSPFRTQFHDDDAMVAAVAFWPRKNE